MRRETKPSGCCVQSGLKGDKRKQGDRLTHLIHCPADNNGGGLPFSIDSINGEKGKDLGCILKTEWTELINELNVGMKKKELSRMIPRFLV